MTNKPFSGILRGVMVVSMLIGASGCFSLGRTEPPTRHYVLGEATPPAAAATSVAGDGLSIGIRRLRLAPYLEPSLIATRRGGEVRYAEFHRWAEPLSSGINRTVAAHLRESGAARLVDVAPWPTGAEYDYLVEIRVDHFEGVVAAEGAGEAYMRADWTIIAESDGEVLSRGTTESRVAGWSIDDYSTLVQLLDAGIGTLATDLATALALLPTRSAGSSNESAVNP